MLFKMRKIQCGEMYVRHTEYIITEYSLALMKKKTVSLKDLVLLWMHCNYHLKMYFILIDDLDMYNPVW